MDTKKIEDLMRRVVREEGIGRFPRWMGVRQLARYISRPEKSIYNMVQRGEIPCIRTGGQIRGKLVFDKLEIDEWMESFKIDRENHLHSD